MLAIISCLKQLQAVDEDRKEKMKRQIIGILIALAATELAPRAEMRIWSDKKGNSIEAEFVNFFSGKVVLKTTAGKQFKVPVSGLSAEDQKYLKNVVPPTIGIEVAMNRETKILSSSSDSIRKTEKIKAQVTLTKKNREPCGRKFTAYLYVFAKNIRENELMVLDAAEHGFSFEKKNKIVFSGNPVETERTERSYSRSNEGQEYEGYLVVIEGDRGTVLYTKGSRPLYETHAGQIRKAEKGTCFDPKFRHPAKPPPSSERS